MSLHKAVTLLGRETHLSKLVANGKDEDLRAPNGEHAFVSAPCSWTVGKQVTRGTCFVTERHALFATSGSGTVAHKVRLRQVRTDGSVTDARVLRASGFELRVNDFLLSAAFKSDKVRDDVRAWITTLASRDEAPLQSTDARPLTSSEASSLADGPSSQLSHFSVSGLQSPTYFSTLESAPQSSAPSTSFVQDAAARLSAVESEPGFPESAGAVLQERSAPRNFEYSTRAKSKVKFDADVEPTKAAKSSGAPISSQDTGSRRNANGENLEVIAEGVSMLTLSLGVAVLVVAIVTQVTVSNHRAHIGELHARMASQVRNSKSTTGAGNNGNNGDVRFEREAAAIRASLETLKKSGGAWHRTRLSHGGARESFSDSETASSRGTRDMRSEMQERFAGTFRTEPKYDIVFKMDLDQDHAESGVSGRRKRLEHSAPVHAAAAPNRREQKHATSNDAASSSYAPTESPPTLPENSRRLEAGALSTEDASEDEHSQQHGKHRLSAGVPPPQVSPENMQNVMRNALMVLAEQYVRERLGNEVMSAMRLKGWAIYDPRVLALLESKPGDPIRQHLFEMLASVDPSAVGIEEKSAAVSV